MPKLTQTQVKEKADEYAGCLESISKLNAAYASETDSILAKHTRQRDRLAVKQAEELKPFDEKYQPEIDALSVQAHAIATEVLEWLRSQKKSITLEGAKAFAVFFKGKRPGTVRQADPEQFIALCKKRGIDGFWKAVNIVLKVAEPMIGKNDLDAICTKPDVDVEEPSLTVKKLEA